MPRALLLLLLAVALLPIAPAAAQDGGTGGPTTEFEDSGGTAWTSEDGEQAFLAAVAEGSPRVRLTEIGRTLQDRPIQLVALGAPAPATAAEALDRPTLYLTCSVHGNEPAGREACLIRLRDLAFTDDPALVDLLSRVTIIVTPNANPDGRAANTRGNSTGADVNRDHLNLRQAESQAIAAVIRDWQPDIVMDMHEYGPATPVVYDDDVLVLWPQNVNVDDALYEMAVELGHDHIIAGAEEEGYTADEYGVQSAGDVDITQTAGDEDEGILRNVGGLRHALGILIESSTTPSPLAPTELLDNAMSRRVTSQAITIDEALEFLDERGEAARATSEESRARKAAEGADRSAPVFFGGQRTDSTLDGSGPPPTPEETVDPPPCGYALTEAQLAEVEQTLDLHGITWFEGPGGIEVPMGQAAEPIIPLLLDPRGVRNHFTGTDSTWEGGPDDVPIALDTCTPPPTREVRRIEGPDRPATAVAAAADAAPDADTIVLATTRDYADALGGTVLARRLDAALLLSDAEALSPAVATEVERRGVTEAVLLGGTAALSADVESALVDLGVDVRRIAGANRFETAGLIADEIGLGTPEGGDRVVVVEGEHADPARGWPDAISAAVLDTPILLVNAERLPAETADRIAAADVTIVGGRVSVGEAVTAEIAARASTVERLAGDTRYATSRAVHDARSSGGATPPALWLASGRDWPEALIGAANGALFLIIDGQDPAGSPETTSVLADEPDTFGDVVLVGDDDAITPAVEAALRELLGV